MEQGFIRGLAETSKREEREDYWWCVSCAARKPANAEEAPVRTKCGLVEGRRSKPRWHPSSVWNSRGCSRCLKLETRLRNQSRGCSSLCWLAIPFTSLS